MAARAGQENEVAAAVRRRLDAIAPARLTGTRPDPDDRRRHLVALTQAGEATVGRLLPRAVRITEDTLAPLGGEERAALAALLAKLC